MLYKLDDLVRPFAHKILVVIEPLLIDEDYYARVEGREIIANLSKVLPRNPELIFGGGSGVAPWTSSHKIPRNPVRKP